MFKRLAALAIAVLMTASFSMSAALSEGDRYAASRERLFDDLLDYVSVSERIWGGILWTVDFFDRYDTENSWESLQTARAALVIARQGLSDCVLPEPKLTRDDHFAFMDRGLDFSFMDYNSAAVDNDRMTALNLCENMHYFIMLGALTKEDWEICREKTAFERKLSGYMIRYLALTADWVIATLNDPAAAEEFEREFAEKCPLTSAFRLKERKTPAEIEEDVDALMTEMEALLAEDAAVEGAMTHRLNVMTDIVDTADLAAVRESIRPISGMPPILPFSSWYSDREISFVWRENGNEVPAPEMGDPLRMPDGWSLVMTGVEEKEFAEYLDELAGFGAVCSAEATEEKKTVYDCAYRGNAFAIVREENQVTFVMDGDPLSFVPVWYWYAVRDAGE